jgi:hypothetical protein
MVTNPHVFPIEVWMGIFYPDVCIYAYALHHHTAIEAVHG